MGGTFSSGRRGNEYSGNFKFQDAAFEVENETKEDHPRYDLRYRLMSSIAHPDASGFPEMFHIDNKALTISVSRETTLHAFDLQVSIAEDMIRAMKFVRDQVGIIAADIVLFDRRLFNVASEHFNV
jgi:hypothetical protein